MDHSLSILVFQEERHFPGREVLMFCLGLLSSYYLVCLGDKDSSRGRDINILLDVLFFNGLLFEEKLRKFIKKVH